MKLWDGWEKECRPGYMSGEPVFFYKKPENKSIIAYAYREHCTGCQEPFLAQYRKKGVYTTYCSPECKDAYCKASEEGRKRIGEANKNRSPEDKRSSVEKTRATNAAKPAGWDCGRVRSLESLTLSAERGRKSDRELIAVNRELNTYRNNARCNHREFDLSAEDLRALITQPCHYCGVEPFRVRTLHHSGKHLHLADENFLFHGVDRVDSSLGYTIDNVVTACEICNKAKVNRSAIDFVIWILRADYFVHNRPDTLIYYGDITEKQRTPLNDVFRIYCSHKDRNAVNKAVVKNTIPINDFAKLIRTQCYYCGSPPSNCIVPRGKRSKVLYYNGLDRVNPDGIYETSNVVPCCVHCNRAKRLMVRDDFCTWLHRAAKHIRATPELFNLAEANFIDQVMGMA